MILANRQGFCPPDLCATASRLRLRRSNRTGRPILVFLTARDPRIALEDMLAAIPSGIADETAQIDFRQVARGAARPIHRRARASDRLRSKSRDPGVAEAEARRRPPRRRSATSGTCSPPYVALLLLPLILERARGLALPILCVRQSKPCKKTWKSNKKLTARHAALGVSWTSRPRLRALRSVVGSGAFGPAAPSGRAPRSWVEGAVLEHATGSGEHRGRDRRRRPL